MGADSSYAISQNNNNRNTQGLKEDKMMRDKIENVLEQLKLIRDNEAVLKDVDWLTFQISLLPIPFIQQAGQVANKIVTDHSLNVKFNEIKDDISKRGIEIAELKTEVEQVAAMAKIANDDSVIKNKIEKFASELVEKMGQEKSEFNVDTTNWSTQAIIKQIVDAHIVSIRAVNHSQNILKDTRIKATKTDLQAHDHSINIIDGTEFKGEKGSVGMSGIGQTGRVEVKDSSVSFYGNSSLIFGARPDTVNGVCPFCGGSVTVERYKLAGYSSIQCPHCSKIVPYKIN